MSHFWMMRREGFSSIQPGPGFAGTKSSEAAMQGRRSQATASVTASLTHFGQVTLRSNHPSPLIQTCPLFGPYPYAPRLLQNRVLNPGSSGVQPKCSHRYLPIYIYVCIYIYIYIHTYISSRPPPPRRPPP